MEGEDMIQIQKSATADTRTCDYRAVTKETLLTSSRQHIADVQAALAFFSAKLAEASAEHDKDKISDIGAFHEDFVTGFATHEWWDRHRQINRHHLTEADGVPDDVTLIDVLDFVADCVMAGMARSGSFRPLELSPDVLVRALHNTAALLQSHVVVVGE